MSKAKPCARESCGHVKTAHSGGTCSIPDCKCEAYVDPAQLTAHAELLDDGSYRCRLVWPSSHHCHQIEHSEAEITEHLRVDHRIDNEQIIVIAGVPEPIVHRGAHHDRVEGEKCNYHGCLREKAFADAWERWQRQQHILASLATAPAKDGEPGSWQPMYALGTRDRLKRAWAEIDEGRELTTGELYSQRDATVAATVIQWLGTNVGIDFVESTLRKAGYVVELRDVRDAREKRLRENEERFKDLAHQWQHRAGVLHDAFTKLHSAWSAIEQVVSTRLTDLTLAALSFARIHCSNEADHFEHFVEQWIAAKAKRAFTEIFPAPSNAGNTLREIGNSISDAYSAIMDLRHILAQPTTRAESIEIEKAGEPLFTTEDTQQLSDVPAAALDRVITAAARATGETEQEAKIKALLAEYDQGKMASHRAMEQVRKLLDRSQDTEPAEPAEFQ